MPSAPPPGPFLVRWAWTGASTTRGRHPPRKVLSGWGSPTTARPSGKNRGCQSWSPGEPDFRMAAWRSHAHSSVSLGVRVGRSPVSRLTELWPCVSGTAHGDCPWPVTRGLVDQQGLTLGVSWASCSPWMPMRSMWPVARLTGQSSKRAARDSYHTGLVTLSDWLRRAWTGQWPCFAV